jgi:hypothetical protein
MKKLILTGSSSSIFVSDRIKVNFCYLNYRKFLLFELHSILHYISLKDDIRVETDSAGVLKLSSSGDSKYLNNFISKIGALSSLKKKVLILKGLGLKASFSRRKGRLDLKLGFSHICRVFLEKGIFLRIRKNFIFIESLSKDKLGSFVNKVRNLRVPNIYKGKGIWHRNKKLKLKEVKKKK